MSADPSTAKDPNELRDKARACRLLQQSFRSLLLSTVDSGGVPEISYAPCIRDERGDFWVFISELASHTANLRQRTDCSVMFIRDEQDCRNLFARERLSWRCQAQERERDSDQGREILEQMAAQLGETLVLLRQLPDFHLFCLQPQSGRYVSGFGNAWQVDPVSGELSHISAETLRKRS